MDGLAHSPQALQRGGRPANKTCISGSSRALSKLVCNKYFNSETWSFQLCCSSVASAPVAAVDAVAVVAVGVLSTVLLLLLLLLRESGMEWGRKKGNIFVVVDGQ